MGSHAAFHDLDRSTVEVLGATGRTAGTGVLVSRDGLVVTASSVARAAGPGGEPIEVVFRYRRPGTDRLVARGARGPVVGDDGRLALLRVAPGWPIDADDVAPLGAFADLPGISFSTVAYVGPRGRWLAGRCAPDPVDADALLLTGETVGLAAAGAPVWDRLAQELVGIVVDGGARAVRTTRLAGSPFALARPRDDASVPRLTDEVREALPTPTTPAEGVTVTHGDTTLRADEWRARMVSTLCVGRSEMVERLLRERADPTIRTTAVVGLGGEGKSTVARHAVLAMLDDSACTPHVVLWWEFLRPSADEFLDTAQDVVYGAALTDDMRAQSAPAKARSIVAGLERTGPVLFVLDGLEQHQVPGDDEYGSLDHDGLRTFLQLLAGTDHASRALITTRLAVADLAGLEPHRSHRLAGLAVDDGVALLTALGVRREPTVLSDFVVLTHGHALTLKLSGSLVVRLHAGAPDRLGELDLSADDSDEENVARVLGRYDGYLAPADRDALIRSSVYQVSVTADGLDLTRATADRFVGMGLLDPSERDEFTLHPIVRTHYGGILRHEWSALEQAAAHQRAVDYFLPRAARRSDRTLTDLEPSVEAFHHYCLLRDYDRAYATYLDIDTPRADTAGDTSRVLTYRLGAYQRDLDLVTRLFVGDDVRNRPRRVSEFPDAAAYLLNEAGLCLMSIGDLAACRLPFERAVRDARERRDVEAETKTRFNLVELDIHQGRLAAARHAADEALELLRDGAHARRQWRGLAYRAWAEHLQGDLATASATFDEAERVQRRVRDGIPHLYDLWGAWHAEHLARIGDLERAWAVAATNAHVSEEDGYREALSQCRRVEGDLLAADGDVWGAWRRYGEALELADQITHRQVELEVKLRRATMRDRPEGSANDVYSELRTAQQLAQESGFRLFEIDADIGLAALHAAQGRHEAAAAAAARALRDSEAIGYHWGREDARRVVTG